MSGAKFPYVAEVRVAFDTSHRLSGTRDPRFKPCATEKRKLVASLTEAGTWKTGLPIAISMDSVETKSLGPATMAS